MKNELSALDINQLVKEFQVLKNGKVDQIYQFDRKDLILQFFVSGKGKFMLRILPKFVFLTAKKQDATEFGFCKFLRKYLENARLLYIEQIGFERIVKLSFDTKDGQLELFIESFDKGNVILVKNKMIIGCEEMQRWKDRTIAPKEEYKFNRRRYDFLKITKNEISTILKETKQDSLVKVLASDLGLGGIYAEEACLLAGIDKKTVPKDVKIDKLMVALDKLSKSKLDPMVVYEGDAVKDVVPFDLLAYKDFRKDRKESFNDALDFVLSSDLLKTTKSDELKAKEKKIEKINTILEIQQKSLGKIELEVKENQRKGEIIYENYQLINEILTEIKKAREKYSWKEIKDRLKGHKVVKNIDEKEGKIIVEI